MHGRIGIDSHGNIGFESHFGYAAGEIARELRRWTEEAVEAGDVENHRIAWLGIAGSGLVVGVFHARREGMGAIKQRVMRCTFLRERSAAQMNPRTSLRLKFGHAQVDSCLARTGIGGNHRKHRRRTIEHSHRLLAQFRRGTQEDFHRKLRNVDAGKKHSSICHPERSEESLLNRQSLDWNRDSSTPQPRVRNDQF